MGHGFFAVDVLAGVARTNYHTLVSMVRHGRDDLIDIFALQQLVITACREQMGITGDLLGEDVPAIVEIGGRDAFGARQAEGFWSRPESCIPMPIMPRRIRSPETAAGVQHPMPGMGTIRLSGRPLRNRPHSESFAEECGTS
jgi:hypothetical protein